MMIDKGRYTEHYSKKGATYKSCVSCMESQVGQKSNILKKFLFVHFGLPYLFTYNYSHCNCNFLTLYLFTSYLHVCVLRHFFLYFCVFFCTLKNIFPLKLKLNVELVLQKIFGKFLFPQLLLYKIRT